MSIFIVIVIGLVLLFVVVPKIWEILKKIFSGVGILIILVLSVSFIKMILKPIPLSVAESIFKLVKIALLIYGVVKIYQYVTICEEVNEYNNAIDCIGKFVEDKCSKMGRFTVEEVSKEIIADNSREESWRIIMKDKKGRKELYIKELLDVMQQQKVILKKAVLNQNGCEGMVLYESSYPALEVTNTLPSLVITLEDD